MNHRIPLLLGLLVVQLILVGLLTLGDDETESAERFLSVDPALVNGMTISAGAGAGVSLTRDGENWSLPGGLPADPDKVTDVITSLLESSAVWPVTTSTDSHSRFEVTEENHQRRLLLRSDDEVLADLLLGTSPGFRRVHARLADEDSVYSIDFAVHEVPADADEWLDRTLLHPAAIHQVTFDDGAVLTLVEDNAEERGDRVWLLDGAPSDPEAANSLVERIERLTVMGLHDPATDEEGPGPGEPRSVTVEDADGSYRLTFRHDEVADEYVLDTDRFPGRFTVASYLAEQILIDPADLALKESVESPATEEAASP